LQLGGVELHEHHFFDVFEEIADEESAVLSLIDCDLVHLLELSQLFSLEFNPLPCNLAIIESQVLPQVQKLKVVLELSRREEMECNFGAVDDHRFPSIVLLKLLQHLPDCGLLVQLIPLEVKRKHLSLLDLDIVTE